MNRCQFCGSNIPPDARFCGICGRVQEKVGGVSDYPASNKNNGNQVVGTGTTGGSRGNTRRPYQFPSPSLQPDTNLQEPAPSVGYQQERPAHSANPQASRLVLPAAPALTARPDAGP